MRDVLIPLSAVSTGQEDGRGGGGVPRSGIAWHERQTMETSSAPMWRPVLATREGHPARCPLAMVVALFSLVAGAVGAGAQEGTPSVSLDAFGPAECTVEPRSEVELRTLFREVATTPLPASLDASPSPAVVPMGVPADEQTVAEITASWRQYLACLSAGDQARMFALLSDDMVRRQFVVDIAFGVTEDALFAFLAATPIPLPPDQFVPFVPFDDVRLLGDGRVAVVGPGERDRGDVRIFAMADDRWVLDDWYELT
jgi:ketosteroid isomerase-like protein